MSETKNASGREVGILEVVEVIESLIEAATWDDMDEPEVEAVEAGEAILARLVGPERETATRMTSKYMIADREFCELLADDLCLHPDEVAEVFLGEPVKRCFKVAIWAIDAADKEIMEAGGIHGRRGPRVAKILREWAQGNQCGAYRRAQKERQYYDESEAKEGA